MARTIARARAAAASKAGGCKSQGSCPGQGRPVPGPESQAGRTYCGLLLDDNRSGVAGTSCWTWTSKGSLGDKDKQGGVQRARQCSQKGVQRAWENPGSHGGRQHGAQQASEHAPAHFRVTLGDPPEACPGAFGCARVIRATEGKQFGVPGTRLRKDA